MNCKTCGNPLPPGAIVCPKCNTPAVAPRRDEFYRVDIAHDGETCDEAIRKLDAAVEYALLNNYKGVKCIHGRGAYGHTHSIKDAAIRHLNRWIDRMGYGKLKRDKFTDGASILYF